MRNFLRPSVLIFIAVLVLLPFIIPNPFILDLVIRIGFAAIVALGLNFLMGFAGQVSIGHAAFFAIGSYASGILTTQFGITPILGLLIGAVGTGLLSYLIAKPILKLKGHSLTMATLGLGIIVSMVLINEVKYTGGPDGMPVGQFTIGKFAIDSPMTWYVVIAVLLTILVVMSLNLFTSPAGRALRALNGSEVAAKVMGVDVAVFKNRVFVLSAVIASIAGSLYAHYSSFITPHLSGFMHSIEIATMVVVGGMASTFGVVLGAALMLILPQLFGGLQEYEMIFFSLILMSTMIFLPQGIVPSIVQKFSRRSK